MNQLEQYTQFQIHKSGQVRLKARREVVWPYLLDFPSFNDTFERVEVISGEENKVGSISRLTKREGKWWRPPYLVKIVHIDEGSQIVWKMYPTDGEDFSSFVDFSLTDLGAETLFMTRLYREHRIPLCSPADVEKAKQDVIAASNRLETEMMFPNLKRLVEKG